jgi:hypothetical protein
MSNPPAQFPLGGVRTLIGNLEFIFVLSPEGDGHIQVYAGAPAGTGKGDVVLMLDANGFEQLKAAVKSADALIDRMIAEGRVKRMVLPY